MAPTFAMLLKKHIEKMSAFRLSTMLMKIKELNVSFQDLPQTKGVIGLGEQAQETRKSGPRSEIRHPRSRIGEVRESSFVARRARFRVSNSESRMPNPELPIPHAESKTRRGNAVSRVPRPASQIPNPESRFPNPVFRIPCPVFRIPIATQYDGVLTPMDLGRLIGGARWLTAGVWVAPPSRAFRPGSASKVGRHSESLFPSPIRTPELSSERNPPMNPRGEVRFPATLVQGIVASAWWLVRSG